MQLGVLQVGLSDHQIALAGRHLGLRVHHIQAGHHTLIEGPRVVPVQLVRYGQRLFRRAHGFPRADQIPVGVLGAGQRGDHLLAEGLPFDSPLVFRHLDQGPVHLVAESVHQLLGHRKREARRECRIVQKVQLRGGLRL